MNWLKEQNRKTREFIRGDFGDMLWMCAVAFGVLILAGCGSDAYVKRGTRLVEFATDGERVQKYLEDKPARCLF